MPTSKGHIHGLVCMHVKQYFPHASKCIAHGLLQYAQRDACRIGVTCIVFLYTLSCLHTVTHTPYSSICIVNWSIKACWACGKALQCFLTIMEGMLKIILGKGGLTEPLLCMNRPGILPCTLLGQCWLSRDLI